MHKDINIITAKNGYVIQYTDIDFAEQNGVRPLTETHVMEVVASELKLIKRLREIFEMHTRYDELVQLTSGATQLNG